VGCEICSPDLKRTPRALPVDIFFCMTDRSVSGRDRTSAWRSAAGYGAWAQSVLGSIPRLRMPLKTPPFTRRSTLRLNRPSGGPSSKPVPPPTGDFRPIVLCWGLMIAMAARALEPRRWLWSARGARFGLTGGRRDSSTASLWLEMIGLAGAGGAIAVRFLLLSSAGLAAPGAFTAAFQMSPALLSLLTAPLQMYHLPSLSTAREAEEKRRMLEAFLSFSGLLGDGVAVLRIAGKALLIQLLHPADFVPALAFLDWFFPGLLHPGAVLGLRVGDAGGRVRPNGLLGGGGPVRHLRCAHRSDALPRRRSLAHRTAFLVTRALALWLTARTTRRSYRTRPEEPIGGRLRRLVPAVAVAAVAAAGMGKPGFDWIVAALAGNALLVRAAAARPQERAALARAFFGRRMAD
jgi:hypothetical protein